MNYLFSKGIVVVSRIYIINLINALLRSTHINMGMKVYAI
ncbi:MAG: hypothetical protein ACJA1S_001838 [Cellvibrionaceae bacterium]|jgi:hypothetical protein